MTAAFEIGFGLPRIEWVLEAINIVSACGARRSRCPGVR
jgi:hypothetical protein